MAFPAPLPAGQVAPDKNAQQVTFARDIAPILQRSCQTCHRPDSVAPASLFARAGLRAGDVVTAVDGRPLRSIDDAAELYARAGTARNIAIQVVRADKPITLHIAIN